MSIPCFPQTFSYLDQSGQSIISCSCDKVADDLSIREAPLVMPNAWIRPCQPSVGTANWETVSTEVDWLSGSTSSLSHPFFMYALTLYIIHCVFYWR